MYIAPLVEIGQNSVHDRMNCAEEVPSSCGLLLHLISRATGRSQDISDLGEHLHLIVHIIPDVEALGHQAHASTS